MQTKIMTKFSWEPEGTKMNVKRTERGWAGHFICAAECQFRRNTLLELDDKRIIVSTVGRLESLPTDKTQRWNTLGLGRYFETMAFNAKFDGRYWDADVHHQVSFCSPWSIDTWDADDKANDMHEAVVTEIAEDLERGTYDQ